MGTYPATCVVGFELGSCFWFDFYFRQAYFQFYCFHRQISSIVSVRYRSGLCLNLRVYYFHVSSNLTRLRTRFLYKVIDSRSTWDSRFNIGLHNDCLSEILFWKNYIVNLNSRNIVPYQAPFLLSFSDASNVACGAYLVGTEEVSHRMWSSSILRQKRALHGENLTLSRPRGSPLTSKIVWR